jgi:urease accessory protein
MRRAIAAYPRGRWPEEAAVDTVTLPYLDRHRRRIRLVGDSGRAFLLDLPRATHLADGAGLELEEGGFIRVRAAAEPVFDIEAEEPQTLIRIAWHLGNRHLPVQVAGRHLRIRADHVIAEMLTGLGGRLTAREALFDPETGAYAAAGEHHHGDDGDG